MVTCAVFSRCHLFSQPIELFQSWKLIQRLRVLCACRMKRGWFASEWFSSVVCGWGGLLSCAEGVRVATDWYARSVRVRLEVNHAVGKAWVVWRT